MTAPFRAALGAAFDALPPTLQEFHGGGDATRCFRGRAEVIRGSGALARVACWFGGFPPAASECAFAVTVHSSPQGEIWERRFNTWLTRSALSYDAGTGTLGERFGAVSFVLNLRPIDGGLAMDVARARVVGLIPLPWSLTPESAVRIWQDEAQRYRFDIGVRIAGRRIVRYRGWVVQDAAPAVRARTAR